MSDNTSTRRKFLSRAAAASLAIGSIDRLANQLAANEQQAAQDIFRRGKAEHCIVLWLGGGAGQIDTFDPKRKGDPKEKKPGSYYEAIDTIVPDVQLCEHLPGCAKVMDRINLIRTVHHDVIDEHTAATNRMHTGRLTSGTIVYPSIGSIVAHQKGPAGQGVPAYVVIGYPNLTRGPGFLGAKHSYIYLTDTKAGPAGLTRPPDISAARKQRREQLSTTLRNAYVQRHASDRQIADYVGTALEADRLAGPEFSGVFQLDREPADLREAYDSEFGQRCLLARRLIERGVRFIEVAHNLNFVNGTGWDVHLGGIRNQHVLIRQLDRALSTLIQDLEEKKLLEKTLIVVATEFGRPAEFDNGGGRAHHAKAFSVVLAGGGLKGGKVIGQTDELAMKILNTPVSVPDLHATIHAALGINPAEELYAGDRPVPITDNGQPADELFA